MAGQDALSIAPERVLFPWLAVAMGFGCALYFALRVEPAVWVLWSCGTASVVLMGLRRIGPWSARIPLLALALTLAGFAWAGARAHAVAAPVLAFRYYGPVEGRVVAVDVSRSAAVRLTLDRVALGDLSPDQVPARVRISLHGESGDYLTPRPGQFVMTTAHLSPPEGPVEPGAFDFRRMAWFDRLGAMGYTRVPVLEYMAPQREGFALWLYDLRFRLSAGIRARMPAREGGFATAIITGDRSALDQAGVDALRRSNLAHLLAISGLHMGLLTGAVFFLLRAGLAVVPGVAIRAPIRSWAAVGAIVAATGYLFISGASVATERAYIMVLVMLLGLCFGRRALSLRSVAMAAVVVLIWHPDAVAGAGFQMSFAATAALVVAFGALRGGLWQKIPKVLQGAAAVLFSSLVAGAATAPFSAAHFNMLSGYGLLANLAAVPVMGLLVVPGALLSLVLWPLGADGLGFWVMAQGIAWILGVAHWVAELPGSTRLVPMPPTWVLPMLVVAGLMLLLGPGRIMRIGAALPALVAVWAWSDATRPPVLISSSGGIIGVMTDEGRVLSKGKGDGFSAEVWLAHDADPALQPEAAMRLGFTQASAQSLWADGGSSVTGGARLTLFQYRGKAAPEQGVQACRAGAVVVVTKTVAPPSTASSAPFESGPSCLFFDAKSLRDSGAVALWPDESGRWRVETSQDRVGPRLWANSSARD